MTNRKNISIDEDVFEQMNEQRGEYETWNAYFSRLAGGDE